MNIEYWQFWLGLYERKWIIREELLETNQFELEDELVSPVPILLPTQPRTPKLDSGGP